MPCLGDKGVSTRAPKASIMMAANTFQLVLCLYLLRFHSLVAAQQVYVNSSGNATLTTPCAPSISVTVTPTYRFTPFSFTQTETVRTATALQASPQTTYGLAYDDVRSLFINQSTTTWGNWEPNVTTTASDLSDAYGQAAWSALWQKASLSNFTRGIYTSTAVPTPIASSELILPSPLYFTPSTWYRFPQDFVLGVAGPAAQVEGAIADEGRSPAAPDFYGEVDSPEVLEALGLKAFDNDYTAVEHYYLYKQDIDRLTAIGSQFYSFSISWNRILPFALSGSPVNSQGLQHYDDLIDYALSRGIQPMVTLIHLDAPAQFFGEGPLAALAGRTYYGAEDAGYQNTTFEDAFVNYGKIVMAHFADRVPYWITFNEPQNGCVSGPAIDHVVKSHARLWHFYKNELQGKGKVSLKMGVAPGVPLDPANATHIAATQHYNDLELATFLNPLALGLDYPEAFKITIQDFVPLTKDDLQYLNGTLDFLAADIYSAPVISPVTDIPSCANTNSTNNTFYPTCVTVGTTTRTGWSIGYHPDYQSYATPTYLRTQLNYYWNTFRLPVMITEFGQSTWGTPSPSASAVTDLTFDITRSEFYIGALNEILKTIWDDGVDVIGAIMWSWVDNWEWGTFQHQFGLQYNDRTTQERHFKRSFFDVLDFVKSRQL